MSENGRHNRSLDGQKAVLLQSGEKRTDYKLIRLVEGRNYKQKKTEGK